MTIAWHVGERFVWVPGTVEEPSIRLQIGEPVDCF
jgi:hypothetical protein